MQRPNSSLPEKGGPEPVNASSRDANTVPAAIAPLPSSTGNTIYRNPVHRVYLVTVGAPRPDEAPEVYYKFTARSRGRHGGVPLAATFHKAEVTLEDGLWRAELIGFTYGTLELFSRFKLKGSIVYSQYNVFLSLRPGDYEEPVQPPRVEMPQDWPLFLFPLPRPNGMPFRGTQTEELVDFDVQRGTSPVIAEAGWLVETRDGTRSAQSLIIGDQPGKYSLRPANDPSLLVAQGPLGGTSKTVLALLELPGGEVMTFSLYVVRSKWTYRKLGLGILVVLTVSVVVGIIVSDRRRRFKYDEFD
jgi:hypothetical protein